MAKLLSKQTILDADDIKSEKVPVPEWGGDVKVFGLTAGERDSYEDGLINHSGGKKKVTLNDATARMCSLSIRDEKGKRLFSDKDIAALSRKSADPLNRIFQVAARLSGMEKGDLEEMVKNSETIQKDSSD